MYSLPWNLDPLYWPNPVPDSTCATPPDEHRTFAVTNAGPD